MKKKFLFLSWLIIPVLTDAQTITVNDGNWSQKNVTLSNTPEAALMVRTGDIDNLGFGFSTGFDPFSGNSTPPHAYPWVADTSDPSGTDRIMVIYSFIPGLAPFGQDGYSSTTSRPTNTVSPISLTFTPPATITSARLQIFVDDFQAPVWGANYQVFIDSIRSAAMENIVNSLTQTGPIGKMITYTLPASLLPQLQDGKLDVLFDDNTTGAGDGYAIDFVKLLINTIDTATTHTYLHGTVTDATTSNPIAGVVVSTTSNTTTDTTDANGFYLIPNVTPGIVQLTTYKTGYGQGNMLAVLQQGDSTMVNFQLLSPAPTLIYSSPSFNEMGVDTNRVIKLVFDQIMDTSTFKAAYFTLSDSLNNITGSFSSINDTLVFTPSDLDSNKQYSIMIYHNLKSSNGVFLAQDIQLPFSTVTPTPMGVNTLDDATVKLYPNPVNSMLICKNQKGFKNASIMVTDIVGKKWLEYPSISGYELRIDVKSLPTGIYFLQIKEGSKKSVEKFLKE